jgi:hypothetical protein
MQPTIHWNVNLEVTSEKFSCGSARTIGFAISIETPPVD